MWIEFLKPTKSRRKVKMTYREKVEEAKRKRKERLLSKKRNL